MIGLHFDLVEQQNKLDVHQWENNAVVLVSNGYSYTRVILNLDQLKTFIDDLAIIGTKIEENETKSV